MASKPKKSAPKPARAAAPKKKAAKKAPAAPPRPKLSLEDRVAALEQHALASGAHLPHAYPDEPGDPADAK